MILCACFVFNVFFLLEISLQRERKIFTNFPICHNSFHIDFGVLFAVLGYFVPKKNLIDQLLNSAMCLLLVLIKQIQYSVFFFVIKHFFLYRNVKMLLQFEEAKYCNLSLNNEPNNWKAIE